MTRCTVTIFDTEARCLVQVMLSRGGGNVNSIDFVLLCIASVTWCYLDSLHFRNLGL